MVWVVSVGIEQDDAMVERLQCLVQYLKLVYTLRKSYAN